MLHRTQLDKLTPFLMHLAPSTTDKSHQAETRSFQMASGPARRTSSRVVFLRSRVIYLLCFPSLNSVFLLPNLAQHSPLRTFNAHLDLSCFPFDKNTLSILIGSQNIVRQVEMFEDNTDNVMSMVGKGVNGLPCVGECYLTSAF